MIDICSLEPKGLISLDNALNLIIQAIQPVTTAEEAGLSDALGRVLANNVLSPMAIPCGRTAAMDGYALASADIDDKNTFSLSLAGTSWAGKPFEGMLNPGHCVRIFTGAIVPDGADSVIMQENAVASGDKISFSAKARST